MIAIVLFFIALVLGLAFVTEKKPVWLRVVDAVLLVVVVSYILFIVSMVIGMRNNPF